jgi:hypothetical protein
MVLQLWFGPTLPGQHMLLRLCSLLRLFFIKVLEFLPDASIKALLRLCALLPPRD